MSVTIRLILFCIIYFCIASYATQKTQDVDIYSFHINSMVTSRYAITVIKSRVANRLNESKEIHFQVKIPKNAFITKFKMTIDGKTYDGVVKQKEEAQQQYSQAVSRGESAGMISSVGRSLEDFKTSVTVAAFSKVTFELTYEELLKRSLGRYQLLINAQPMQPVADFKIDVNIHESPDISFLKVEGGLVSGEVANTVTITLSGKEARVSFYPTSMQQTTCKSCNESGLNGDLLIMYDVERSNSSGELQALSGYFVHYFAPTDIQRIPKNVVFIIDQSGSMRGQKIVQTRLAMLKILEDLDEDDYFGLITFDSQVKVWKPELLRATERNLVEAKSFVTDIKAQGSTNINSAVLAGVEIINSHPRQGSASILVLLTDGDPTSGETNPVRIQRNVQKAINGKFPLYCLGFGFDVSFDFLEKMSLENNGLAHRIYEDSDADLQLQGFYEQIATPLLTDVQMNYIGAENLTQTSFSQYYNGSEIIVAGQITNNRLETFQTEIIAVSKSNNVTYQDSVTAADVIDFLPEHENFIQRLWAYLTVKQLLKKQLTLSDQEKEAVKEKALQLALKYKFVTPLTSMVVTKPQENETQVAHKLSEEETKHGSHTYSVRKRKYSARRTSMKMAFFSLPDLPKIGRNHFKGQPLPTVPAVSSVRFIIFAQPKPICYDVPANLQLLLLQDHSSNFTMNGNLHGKGFDLIVLHYKSNHYLHLSTQKIIYKDGKSQVEFPWGQPIKHGTDSVSLNLHQNNQMDVTMGTVHVSVLRHENGGYAFLWPDINQPPNNTNTQGILGKTDLHYIEHGSLIKMKDEEIKATWSTATDYRTPLAPAVQCWLVPFQFALQRALSDFTVLLHSSFIY